MAEWTNDKAASIIKSLLRQSESESNLENFGAAELFANQAAKIASKYSIDIKSIDISFEDASSKVINELGISIVSNIFNRVNARTNLRKVWFEKFAEVIAKAYNCKVAPNLNDGSITFYGFDLDRELAVFMFVKLSEVANELEARERKLAKSKVGKPDYFDFRQKKKISNPKTWMNDEVWIDNFHKGFREEIAKSLKANEDLEKLSKVEDYFNKNRDSSSYNHYYSYISRGGVEAEFNESAYNVGKICGYNVAHKATKSPSALTVKKSVLNNDNVVWILVDTSGSMWGSKINQAIDGTLNYAKTAIEKGFLVGVMEFESEARVISEPVKEVDERFESRVRSLRPNNYTYLVGALRLAQSKMLNRNVKRTIVVVTDGVPTSKWGGENVEETLNVAHDCKRAGIEIQAIGTDGCKQEFLDKLVSGVGLGLLVDNSRLMLGMGELAAKL